MGNAKRAVCFVQLAKTNISKPLFIVCPFTRIF